MVKTAETDRFGELEEILGYRFADRTLLVRALMHSSYANEQTGDPANGNERLEFLGDAVLDFVISVYIYERFSEKAEGDLTKLRAAVVCENALAEIGREFGINRYLLLGKGEDLSGGRYRDALIADSIEAILGAVYLDGGDAAANAVIRKLFTHVMEEAACGQLPGDSKTELQELVQKRGDANIRYELEKEFGPDHAKQFTIAVYVNGKKAGVGTGHSKKVAEAAAARDALARWPRQR